MGRKEDRIREDLKTLFDENLQKLLMTPPLFFIFALTVLPLVFMICMAFTNYSIIDNHLVLFDWVGLDNFKTLFDSSSVLGNTFWSVLISIPIAILFLCLQRFYVDGLSGAVKG